MPDLSHHLSQLLRNCVPCRSVLVQPVTSVPTVSKLVLQACCRGCKSFCRVCVLWCNCLVVTDLSLSGTCFLTPCMAVLCSRMLSYVLSCRRCFCKSASDHLLRQFSKSSPSTIAYTISMTTSSKAWLVEACARHDTYRPPQPVAPCLTPTRIKSSHLLSRQLPQHH